MSHDAKAYATVEVRSDTTEYSKECSRKTLKCEDVILILAYLGCQVTNVKIKDVLSEKETKWLVSVIRYSLGGTANSLESARLEQQNWFGQERVGILIQENMVTTTKVPDAIKLLDSMISMLPLKAGFVAIFVVANKN